MAYKLCLNIKAEGEFILFILLNNVICIKYVTYVRVHHQWLGPPAGGWISKQDEAQEQGRLELF